MLESRIKGASLQNLLGETLEVYYNPWHGCKRLSEGCKNCYVFSIDKAHNKDPRVIYKTKSFHLPLVKKKNGEYKIPDFSWVWMCFSSDFLLQEADSWRQEVWEMIRRRKACTFVFFTKRITRFLECVPQDWGEGYENVVVGCSVENQHCASSRLRAFLEMPIRRRWIVCAPLLEELDLREYLDRERIERVSVGGESGFDSRVCDYRWVLSLREQARAAGISFDFHQSGARFLKDSKLYRIPKNLQRIQAKKAGIDLEFP